jgi:RES domain-containing protein
MRTVWRLIKAAYAKEAFAGAGSRLHGTRWTSRGIPVVYTAESAALAAWEVVVHLPKHALPSDYVLFRVQVPEDTVTVPEPSDLPAGWDADPPSPATQAIGTRWAASRSSLVLQVPSVVIRPETNFLISPEHPDFTRLIISTPEPFLFDPTAFTRSRPQPRRS